MYILLIHQQTDIKNKMVLFPQKKTIYQFDDLKLH